MTVSEGYDAANMVVKVNGEEVTAVDGIYTVEKVSSDLTITVEGVTEAVQKTAGLSVLKFGDTSTEAKAQMFQLIPAFDPAVKEYTVLVPDNSNMFYAWATQAIDRSSSTTINGRAAAFAHVRQRRGRPEFRAADAGTVSFLIAQIRRFSSR